MPSMDVVEFFQHEVQFPYGVIRRVSATLAGTFFLLFTSFSPYKSHIYSATSFLLRF